MSRSRASRRSAALLALFPALLLASRAAASSWSVRDPGQGPVPLAAGTTGATNLSGIAWLGGNDWLAVADKGGAMYPLTISLTPDGRIASAELGPGIAIAGAVDAEGIAFDAASGDVLVADESGPALRKVARATGALVSTVALPAVFSGIRANLALESLSLDPASRALWTANEEALASDGAVSSFSAGTTVRVQRFDGNAGFAPSGQWAWTTAPIAADYGSPGRDVETSGVVDLVALPDGELLVLERSAGGTGLRSQIFQAEFTGATDTGAIAALAGATWQPLGKSSRWSRSFLAQNFEGAGLGPVLADGSRVLLLVSDDGSGLQQALYALAVRIAACGDGVRDLAVEECDDGNAEDGDGCTAACTLERCGDGARNRAGREECDDGNRLAGDGCAADCRLERPEKACRAAIRKAAADYAKGRRKALVACREQLNAGAMLVAADDPARPIDDPARCAGESGAAAAIARAAARLREGVAKAGAPRCTDAMLAVIGACAGTVDGLVSGDGRSGCLVSSHDGAVDAMLDDEYGRRLLPGESALRRCQSAIAALGGKYAGAREKGLLACRAKLLAGAALWRDAGRTLPVRGAADCAAESVTAGKFAAAGAALRARLESTGGCTDLAVAALDGACASALDGLASPAGDAGCLVLGHAAAVDALLAARP